MQFLPGYFFSPDTTPPPCKIFDKGPGEKNLILGVRQAAVYPFAGSWMDLRAGFLLSLTKAAADDDPSALTEHVGTYTGTQLTSNRHWFGLKTNNTSFPRTSGLSFIGFTNTFHGGTSDQQDDSAVISSDSQRGTSTNQYWWRPTNFSDSVDENPHWGFQVWDGTAQRFAGGGHFPHLPQVPASAGGYSTLVAFRIRRPSPTSMKLTFEVPKPTSIYGSDILWTNTPSKPLLQAQLSAWSFPVDTRGPYTFSGATPDAMFAYWPFHNSRLRIHCWGLMTQ